MIYDDLMNSNEVRTLETYVQHCTWECELSSLSNGMILNKGLKIKLNI